MDKTLQDIRAELMGREVVQIGEGKKDDKGIRGR